MILAGNNGSLSENMIEKLRSAGAQEHRSTGVQEYSSQDEAYDSQACSDLHCKGKFIVKP